MTGTGRLAANQAQLSRADLKAVPKTVRAVILLVLTAPYGDRSREGDGEYLARHGPVALLLSRLRDSAIA